MAPVAPLNVALKLAVLDEIPVAAVVVTVAVATAFVVKEYSVPYRYSSDEAL